MVPDFKGFWLKASLKTISNHIGLKDITPNEYKSSLKKNQVAVNWECQRCLLTQKNIEEYWNKYHPIERSVIKDVPT